jgi:hypothetical protein
MLSGSMTVKDPLKSILKFDIKDRSDKAAKFGRLPFSLKNTTDGGLSFAYLKIAERKSIISSTFSLQTGIPLLYQTVLKFVDKSFKIISDIKETIKFNNKNMIMDFFTFIVIIHFS